jgi:septal ring factor EnvC (AmiA/AmiB activator)
MKLMFLILLIFAGSVYASGQTVTVPQEFLTSATRSFQEVRTSRELIAAQKAENAALQKALDAKTAEVAAKDGLIAVLNERDKLRIELINSLTEQNKALAAIKCDTTSLFWGVVKKKQCR